MKRGRIKLGIFSLVLACLAVLPVSAVSFAPYYSYEYNDYDESVDAPIGYVPSETVTGASLGLSVNFNGINDMYYDNEDTLYLLDSGNSRILAVDSQMQLKKEYSGFVDQNGAEIQFNGAQGLTVGPDGRMYVADTQGYRVLIINPDGLVERIITRPDEALNNTEAAFDAQKVLLDKDGMLYVTAKSINLGIFVFSPEGEFVQFWGANEVPTTMQAMMNYIRKRFLTQIQLEAFQLATPVTVTNFDIDADGFIYTLSPYKDEGTVAVPGLLRKLNYKGEDVLDPELVFGDVEWDRKPYPQTVRTWFGDVDIDDQGFINLVDTARGRVFQYTDSGQLITVFGAIGDQTGCFQYPSAIESVGENILVSDSKKNVVYVFSPTDYVRSVRSAVDRMNRYDLEGSLDEWQAILSKNTNSLYAYMGMGRVYDAQGDYVQAMKYYKLAHAQEDYSKSFQQYRTQWLSQYYPVVLLVIIAIVALLVLAAWLIKRFSVVPEGAAFSPLESKYSFPIYTLFHPTDGFSQFKFRKNQSVLLALGIVVVWAVVVTIQFFATGPSFNDNRPIDYSLWVNLLQTVGVYLLFIVANWAVCTLMDGKGTLSEIAATVSYALLPYIVSILINVGLSNILSQSEAVFMSMVTVLGVAWSLLILICGLYAIHQYSFTKTLLSILLTLIGMMLIVFLAILFFGLLQQAWTFAVSVYKEALLRF